MKPSLSFIPAWLIAMCCLTTPALAAEETKQGLTARQKAMVPIASFTATSDQHALESAMEQGMEAGLTINEVKEILIHSYAYAGFPRALNGITTYIDVLEQRKTKGIEDPVGKNATPMPEAFDKTTYGHHVRNSLVGRDLSERQSGYPVFAPAIDTFLVEHLFADIFYRDVLSHQDRELLTISMLSAMSGTEAQLKAHLNIAMNIGFSQQQLEAFILLLNQSVNSAASIRAENTLSELVTLTSIVNQPQSVTVTRTVSATPASADFFTGDVSISSRFSAPIQDGYRGGLVEFEAGARTAWHTHPLGQTLIVTSGRGYVQQEGSEKQEILPGDVIWIPENTRHWHGAAPDSAMSHVAIVSPKDGVSVEWMQQVTKDEYHQ